MVSLTKDIIFFDDLQLLFVPFWASLPFQFSEGGSVRYDQVRADLTQTFSLIHVLECISASIPSCPPPAKSLGAGSRQSGRLTFVPFVQLESLTMEGRK